MLIEKGISMNPLILRCRCGDPLPKKELRTFSLEVGRGGSPEFFCSKVCLNVACRDQTISKCRELGIPFDPSKYEIPTRLEPG